MLSRKLFAQFDQLVGLLSASGAVVAAAALAVIAGSVIFEVIARSVFQSPTIWAIEISTYSITVAGFMAAAFVLRGNGHLEISLLTGRLSKEASRRLGILTDLFALSFCVLVVIYGKRLVELSHLIGAVSVSELRVEQWIPQLAIPIGFALLALEFLCRILVRLNLVSRVISQDPAAVHD
jgi:C4-dicarboxylate transporter, DctQ subunit